MAMTPVRSVGPSAQEDIDRALLRRVARGDRDAFDAMYFDYHRRLSRFLLRFSPEYSNIEEIINDTMFCVWKQASQFEGRSKVSTWIMSIAYHQSTNLLRGISRARQRDQLAADDQAQLAQAPGDSDVLARSEWIGKALEQLPVEQRTALELGYMLGHSTSEIAEICDCPINTVKSRMFAARKALRCLLPTLAGDSNSLEDRAR